MVESTVSSSVGLVYHLRNHCPISEGAPSPSYPTSPPSSLRWIGANWPRLDALRNHLHNSVPHGCRGRRRVRISQTDRSHGNAVAAPGRFVAGRWRLTIGSTRESGHQRRRYSAIPRQVRASDSYTPNPSHSHCHPSPHLNSHVHPHTCAYSPANENTGANPNAYSHPNPHACPRNYRRIALGGRRHR